MIAILPASRLVTPVMAFLDIQKLSVLLAAASPYISTPPGLVKALEILGV